MTGLIRLRATTFVIVLASATLLLTLVSPFLARAAAPPDICPERNDGFSDACQLGTPGADGRTLQGFLDHPGDVDAYQFDVAQPSAVHLTLADLWYDCDIALYEKSTGVFIAQAHFVAESRRSGEGQSQISAPELIVERLEVGAYTAFVISGDLLSYSDSQGYTLRVALSPPTVPQPLPPVGQEPSWKKSGYQLALTMEPPDATPFSLMTFTAIVDPPFTDLFDFAWEIDGKPSPEGNVPVVQMGNPSVGRHTVKVTAIGARDYPDPDRPHRPPTLSAIGSFEVRPPTR
jgi:hypothetical protein